VTGVRRVLRTDAQTPAKGPPAALRNRVGYVSYRISGDLSRLRHMRHRAVRMQATDGANIEPQRPG